jgi:DHA2 family multidrug resistance protein
MIVMMPISGALYNRLGPRLMIGTGLILTAATQWTMGHFTLQTGAQDILIPQIIQGMGFGLVFVALSTVALSTIPKAMMTSATGLNNLIRQLGGSFGTAYVVVLLTRHIDQARVDLVGYANPASQGFMQRLQGMTGLFVQHGYSLSQARDAALAAIDGLIEQQAAMLAYDYIFLWIGLLFAVCLLLLPFLKSGSNAPVEKHVAVD